MQTMTLTQTCVMAILQAIAVVIFIFIVVPLTTFAERKVLGYLQDRLGATRIAGSRNGLTGWLNRGMWKMGKVPMLSILRGQGEKEREQVGRFVRVFAVENGASILVLDEPTAALDVRAEAAAADQDQPLAVVGVLVDELHGHAATEGVPDDGRLRDAQLVERLDVSALRK